MHQPLKSNGEPKGRHVHPYMMGFDFFQLTRMDIFRMSVPNESGPPSLFKPLSDTYIFWVKKWMEWFDGETLSPSLNLMPHKHSSNVIYVE